MLKTPKQMFDTIARDAEVAGFQRLGLPGPDLIV
jgi:hypothetical protein